MTNIPCHPQHSINVLNSTITNSQPSPSNCYYPAHTTSFSKWMQHKLFKYKHIFILYIYTTHVLRIQNYDRWPQWINDHTFMQKCESIYTDKKKTQHNPNKQIYFYDPCLTTNMLGKAIYYWIRFLFQMLGDSSGRWELTARIRKVLWNISFHVPLDCVPTWFSSLHCVYTELGSPGAIMGKHFTI